ncbi:MAG: NAD(P)H-dependent oxidoreductase subunit E [Actinomycetota bacterium]|nr:NAD(P)H-dependent oxidoreductase subunit E [Actinomycetota bacterium]
MTIPAPNPYEQNRVQREQQGRAPQGEEERVFDDELRAKAAEIVAKYPNPRSAVLPLLFLAQSVEGYVTEAGMREVAEILGQTPASVLAAGSFYSMIKKVPQGDYLISICRNISCTHMGGRKLIAAVEERLGITDGESTDDGKFTLETAECLATCDGAPTMQISYEDFYNVTPASLIEAIDRLESGHEVKSKRDEPVKTAKEVSYETAVVGIYKKMGEDMRTRTTGGEVLPPDMAPGFRPPERGSLEGGGAGEGNVSGG